MANPIEYAKSHPVIAGGVGVVAIIIFYFLFLRGGAAPVDNTAAQLAAADAAATASGNQLAAATLASQTAINQTKIAADTQTTIAGDALSAHLADVAAASGVASRSIDLQASTVAQQGNIFNEVLGSLNNVATTAAAASQNPEQTANISKTFQGFLDFFNIAKGPRSPSPTVPVATPSTTLNPNVG